MSPSRLFRWIVSTWVVTFVVCSLPDLARLNDLPPRKDMIDFYQALAVVALGTSLVAVLLLARLPYLAVSLVVTLMGGFLVGYVRAVMTFGTGAEDGTVWRGYGGAAIGVVSAVAAWALMRLASRQGRDRSPVADPAP